MLLELESGDIKIFEVCSPSNGSYWEVLKSVFTVWDTGSHKLCNECFCDWLLCQQDGPPNVSS